jgi:hypothetical protein
MKSFARIVALAVIIVLGAFPAAIATTKPPVEEQPHMQQALDALRQARRHLEAALPDKGGNRTAAIKACDEAIRRTEAGIKYGDERHDHDHN